MQCSVFFGTKKVTIWKGTPPYEKAECRNLVFDMGQKCTEYPEHEMCVYGGRYILRIKKC